MRRNRTIGIVIAGLMVAGCSSPSAVGSSSTNAASSGSSTSVANNAAGTAQWVAKNRMVLTNLGDDLGSLVTTLPAAVSSRSFSTVTAGCQKLAADVATAKTLPAIPNSAAQKEWSSLLSKLDTASQDCANGVSQSSTQLISQADMKISRSQGKLTSLGHTLGI
jgi:hypothetical protein